MTATKQFSQAPPDKANELFDNLVTTSDTAVKTRERLFADLKEELELLATLQEEHLFPVLRRHGMQELLQEATTDNQETAVLLAALERMPKDSSEFIDKVTELSGASSSTSVMTARNCFPPGVKVLSDEGKLLLSWRRWRMTWPTSMRSTR